MREAKPRTSDAVRAMGTAPMPAVWLVSLSDVPPPPRTPPEQDPDPDAPPPIEEPPHPIPVPRDPPPPPLHARRRGT